MDMDVFSAVGSIQHQTLHGLDPEGGKAASSKLLFSLGISSSERFQVWNLYNEEVGTVAKFSIETPVLVRKFSQLKNEPPTVVSIGATNFEEGVSCCTGNIILYVTRKEYKLFWSIVSIGIEHEVGVHPTAGTMTSVLWETEYTPRDAFAIHCGIDNRITNLGQIMKEQAKRLISYVCNDLVPRIKSGSDSDSVYPIGFIDSRQYVELVVNDERPQLVFAVDVVSGRTHGNPTDIQRIEDPFSARIFVNTYLFGKLSSTLLDPTTTQSIFDAIKEIKQKAETRSLEMKEEPKKDHKLSNLVALIMTLVKFVDKDTSFICNLSLDPRNMSYVKIDFDTSKRTIEIELLNSSNSRHRTFCLTTLGDLLSHLTGVNFDYWWVKKISVLNKKTFVAKIIPEHTNLLCYSMEGGPFGEWSVSSTDADIKLMLQRMASETNDARTGKVPFRYLPEKIENVVLEELSRIYTPFTNEVCSALQRKLKIDLPTWLGCLKESLEPFIKKTITLHLFLKILIEFGLGEADDLVRKLRSLTKEIELSPLQNLAILKVFEERSGDGSEYLFEPMADSQTPFSLCFDLFLKTKFKQEGIPFFNEALTWNEDEYEDVRDLRTDTQAMFLQLFGVNKYLGILAYSTFKINNQQNEESAKKFLSRAFPGLCFKRNFMQWALEIYTDHSKNASIAGFELAISGTGTTQTYGYDLRVSMSPEETREKIERAFLDGSSRTYGTEDLFS
jgi:hypothetical protein